MNTHLDHIEDLAFEGPIGINKTLSMLKAIENQSNITLSLKWDGSPAVVFGINPSNNQFFVSLKSMSRLFYKPSEIDQYITNTAVNRKLKIALEYLPELTLELKMNGIYKGDIVFTQDDLWVDRKHGLLTKPNEIVYSLSQAVEIIDNFRAKQLGIAIHTEYTQPKRLQPQDAIGNVRRTKREQIQKQPTVEQPVVVKTKQEQNVNAIPLIAQLPRYEQNQNISLKSLVAQPKVVKQVEQTQNVVVFPIATSIALTTEDTTRFQNLIHRMEQIATKIETPGFGSLVASGRTKRLLSLYQNSLVRGNVNVSLDFSSGFYSFVENSLNKDILTLHRKKSRLNRIKDRDIFLGRLVKQLPMLVLLREFQQLVVEAKELLLSRIPVTMVGTYFEDEGKLVPGSHEGIVVTDHLTGDVVKLVDRKKFSWRNFRLKESIDTEAP